MANGGDDFKSQQEVDRDFKIYEAGILRLKDVEELLDHLNTMGFWKEEKAIRSKLRDVSEISNVEKQVEILKRKIVKRHGKKNLYKKSFPALRRRKKAKKKEVLVGDVPEPVETAEPTEKEKSLIKKFLPSMEPKDKNKKYISEVKDAVENDPKKPLIIDSGFSEEQRKEQMSIANEKAKLQEERLRISKKEKIISSNFKKYHNVPLSVDKYSYDKEKSRDIVNNLKSLYAKRGKNKSFRKLGS